MFYCKQTRLNKIISLLFFIPLISLSQTKDSLTYPIYYKSKTFEAYIFKIDSANQGDCFESKKFIIPDKKRIDEYELLLSKQFKKINSDYEKKPGWKLSDKVFSNYKRQVAGYVAENGDEILFISGAHLSLNKTKIDYKKTLICSTFQLSKYCLECGNYTPIDWWCIKYNCKTKKFFGFKVFDPS
jgi:hypothetical protein